VNVPHSTCSNSSCCDACYPLPSEQSLLGEVIAEHCLAQYLRYHISCRHFQHIGGKTSKAHDSKQIKRSGRGYVRASTGTHRPLRVRFPRYAHRACDLSFSMRVRGDALQNACSHHIGSNTDALLIRQGYPGELYIRSTVVRRRSLEQSLDVLGPRHVASHVHRYEWLFRLRLPPSLRQIRMLRRSL
jgi:hypothetical protein